MGRLSAFLPGLLSAGLVIVLGILSLYRLRGLDMGRWASSELLINYEGGFVRRGLLGALLALSSEPLALAHQVQVVVVALFFAGFALLLATSRQPFGALASLVLVLFTPGGLFDMALSGFEFLERKEIFFYVAIVVLVLLARRFGVFRPGSIALFSAISVAMVLVHELFFFFFVAPIFAILLLASGVDIKTRSIYAVAYLLTNAAALLASVLNPGNSRIVDAIRSSYQGTDAEELTSEGGGIGALAWDLGKSVGLSRRMLEEGSLLYWVVFVAIAVILILALVVVNADSRRYVAATGIIFSLAFLALLFSFLIGWDWGRWISMFSLSFFLLHELIRIIVKGPATNSEERHQGSPVAALSPTTFRPREFLLFAAVAGFAALTSLIFQMSHCCPQSLSSMVDVRLPF